MSRSKVLVTETVKLWTEDLPEDPKGRNLLLTACCFCSKPVGCAWAAPRQQLGAEHGLNPPAFLFLLAWPAGRPPPGRPLARLSKPVAVMPSSGRPGPVSPGRCCLGFSEAGLAHLHWLAWVMLLGLHSLWLRVFFTVTMSTWCCYPCSCNAARMHQALRSSICCSVRNPDFPSLLFSALVLQRVCLWWPVGEQGCRLEDLLCYSHTGRQEIHNVPGTVCSHHTWELHVPQKAKHAARPKGSPAAPIACLN